MLPLPSAPLPSSATRPAHLRHHLSWPLQREYVCHVVGLVPRPHHLGAAGPAGHLGGKHRAAQLRVQLSNLTAVQWVLANLQECFVSTLAVVQGKGLLLETFHPRFSINIKHTACSAGC